MPHIDDNRENKGTVFAWTWYNHVHIPYRQISYRNIIICLAKVIRVFDIFGHIFIERNFRIHGLRSISEKQMALISFMIRNVHCLQLPGGHQF